MTGRLITLEGGEGAGKSTQAATVSDWLRSRGRTVLQTREPGGTPLAEAVRALVLADWKEGVHPVTEVLLMYAARAAHWRGRIAPALAADHDVVCDRFIDSSDAYQGGEAVPPKVLAMLDQLSLGDRRPDLTLLLDVPPEIGIARARSRGDANRFDQATRSRQAAVRARFLSRAATQPRVVVIDASGDASSVRQAVIAVLEARL